MKSIKKYMVIALCAVIVSCSLIKPLCVEASTNNHVVNIVDMILTKTGIIAEHEILNEIEADFRANMRQLIIEYDAWLTENNITDITIDTFNEYVYSVETDATSTLISNRILGLVDEEAVLKYIIEYRQNNQIEIDPIEMTTGSPVTTGKNVSISNDLADYIRELFEEYTKTDGDFYYVKTIAPSEINPLWFETTAIYDKVVSLVSSLPYLAYATSGDSNMTGYFSFGNDNTMLIKSMSFRVYESEILLLSAGANTTGYNYAISNTYDTSWNTPTKVSWQNGSLSNIKTSYDAMLSDTTYCGHGTKEFNPRQSLEGQYTNTTLCLGLFSNDGRYVKVYNTLEALKADSIGQSTYYVTSNFRDYYDQDNSIKVSGDYVLGNYTSSHDTIQEQINNSGTITNESVSSIVNDYSQTIINNYESSVLPETGDDENGDDNNGGGLGSILDGLGSIISAIADIVGFLLGVIGDVIGLIGDLFTVVFNGLKTLGALIGEFPKLLGEIFVFIPEELINFLILAIEASIGIAIWRKFSKK